MGWFLGDLRSGFRQSRGDLPLSLSILLSLALVLGLNVAVFSFVKAIFLDPMPGLATLVLSSIFAISMIASTSAQPKRLISNPYEAVADEFIDSSRHPRRPARSEGKEVRENEEV